MNLRAKCSNPNCKAFGIEESVTVGKLLGYGAPNDRVICPACGELRTTTKSVTVPRRGSGNRRAGGRPTPPRSSGRR
jgi:hypothetical protein